MGIHRDEAAGDLRNLAQGESGRQLGVACRNLG